MFEALASFGYKTVEFAGYTQGANGPITTQEIRALLDEFGLTAVGTHLSLNTLRTNLRSRSSAARSSAWVHRDRKPADGRHERAGPRSAVPQRRGLQGRRGRVQRVGETCAAAGLKLYQHNHTDEFRFATDQPSVRVYDVWIGETDPRFVHLEMDIYWAYAAKNLFPDSSRSTTCRRSRTGTRSGTSRTAPSPLRPTWTASCLDVGDGVIDFRTFFDEQGKEGYHQYLVERDNAPGGNTNPGQSYRTARAAAPISSASAPRALGSRRVPLPEPAGPAPRRAPRRRIT